MNDSFIFLGPLDDNLYHISPLSLLPSNENNHTHFKERNPTLIKHNFGTYA